MAAGVHVIYYHSVDKSFVTFVSNCSSGRGHHDDGCRVGSKRETRYALNVLFQETIRCGVVEIPNLRADVDLDLFCKVIWVVIDIGGISAIVKKSVAKQSVVGSFQR